jgi:hypothetical protein
MKEEWKDIVGHEGFYTVSSLGNVFSTLKNIPMSAKKEKNGYERITLAKNGARKTVSIHRLVVEAFIGTIPKGFCVDHIDNNRANNARENLRIVDYSFNVKRSFINTIGISKMRTQKKTPQRYRSDIWIYGRKYFLGSWTSKEEAIENYRKTHLEFWGYDHARQV